MFMRYNMDWRSKIKQYSLLISPVMLANTTIFIFKQNTVHEKLWLYKTYEYLMR